MNKYDWVYALIYTSSIIGWYKKYLSKCGSKYAIQMAIVRFWYWLKAVDASAEGFYVMVEFLHEVR